MLGQAKRFTEISSIIEQQKRDDLGIADSHPRGSPMGQSMSMRSVRSGLKSPAGSFYGTANGVFVSG